MALITARLNAGVILGVTVWRYVYNLPLPPTSIRPSLISLTGTVDVKHHERRRRESELTCRPAAQTAGCTQGTPASPSSGRGKDTGSAHTPGPAAKTTTA